MIAVVGWNIPLVRATGLGAEGERDLGRLLALQLYQTGWLRPGSRRRKSMRASPGPTLGSKGTSGDTAPEWVSRDDLLRLVRTRRRSIRTFLEIRDLRFPVSRLLGLLAAGETRESILKAYPYLESEDIEAALRYAAYLAEEETLELSR